MKFKIAWIFTLTLACVITHYTVTGHKSYYELEQDNTKVADQDLEIDGTRRGRSIGGSIFRYIFGGPDQSGLFLRRRRNGLRPDSRSFKTDDSLIRKKSKKSKKSKKGKSKHKSSKGKKRTKGSATTCYLYPDSPDCDPSPSTSYDYSPQLIQVQYGETTTSDISPRDGSPEQQIIQQVSHWQIQPQNIQTVQQQPATPEQSPQKTQQQTQPAPSIDSSQTDHSQLDETEQKIIQASLTSQLQLPGLYSLQPQINYQAVPHTSETLSSSASSLYPQTQGPTSQYTYNNQLILPLPSYASGQNQPKPQSQQIVTTPNTLNIGGYTYARDYNAPTLSLANSYYPTPSVTPATPTVSFSFPGASIPISPSASAQAQNESPSDVETPSASAAIYNAISQMSTQGGPGFSSVSVTPAPLVQQISTQSTPRPIYTIQPPVAHTGTPQQLQQELQQEMRSGITAPREWPRMETGEIMVTPPPVIPNQESVETEMAWKGQNPVTVVTTASPIFTTQMSTMSGQGWEGKEDQMPIPESTALANQNMVHQVQAMQAHNEAYQAQMAASKYKSYSTQNQINSGIAANQNQGQMAGQNEYQSAQAQWAEQQQGENESPEETQQTVTHTWTGQPGQGSGETYQQSYVISSTQQQQPQSPTSGSLFQQFSPTAQPPSHQSSLNLNGGIFNGQFPTLSAQQQQQSQQPLSSEENSGASEENQELINNINTKKARLFSNLPQLNAIPSPQPTYKYFSYVSPSLSPSPAPAPAPPTVSLNGQTIIKNYGGSNQNSLVQNFSPYGKYSQGEGQEGENQGEDNQEDGSPQETVIVTHSHSQVIVDHHHHHGLEDIAMAQSAEEQMTNSQEQGQSIDYPQESQMTQMAGQNQQQQIQNQMVQNQILQSQQQQILQGQQQQQIQSQLVQTQGQPMTQHQILTATPQPPILQYTRSQSQLGSLGHAQTQLPPANLYTSQSPNYSQISMRLSQMAGPLNPFQATENQAAATSQIQNQIPSGPLSQLLSGQNYILGSESQIQTQSRLPPSSSGNNQNLGNNQRTSSTSEIQMPEGLEDLEGVEIPEGYAVSEILDEQGRVLSRPGQTQVQNSGPTGQHQIQNGGQIQSSMGQLSLGQITQSNSPFKVRPPIQSPPPPPPPHSPLPKQQESPQSQVHTWTFKEGINVEAAISKLNPGYMLHSVYTSNQPSKPAKMASPLLNNFHLKSSSPPNIPQSPTSQFPPNYTPPSSQYNYGYRPLENMTPSSTGVPSAQNPGQNIYQGRIQQQQQQQSLIFNTKSPLETMQNVDVIPSTLTKTSYTVSYSPHTPANYNYNPNYQSIGDPALTDSINYPTVNPDQSNLIEMQKRADHFVPNEIPPTPQKSQWITAPKSNSGAKSVGNLNFNTMGQNVKYSTNGMVQNGQGNSNFNPNQRSFTVSQGMTGQNVNQQIVNQHSFNGNLGGNFNPTQRATVVQIRNQNFAPTQKPSMTSANFGPTQRSFSVSQSAGNSQTNPNPQIGVQQQQTLYQNVNQFQKTNVQNLNPTQNYNQGGIVNPRFNQNSGLNSNFQRTSSTQQQQQQLNSNQNYNPVQSVNTQTLISSQSNPAPIPNGNYVNSNKKDESGYTVHSVFSY